MVSTHCVGVDGNGDTPFKRCDDFIGEGAVWNAGTVHCVDVSESGDVSFRRGGIVCGGGEENWIVIVMGDVMVMGDSGNVNVVCGE